MVAIKMFQAKTILLLCAIIMLTTFISQPLAVSALPVPCTDTTCLNGGVCAGTVCDCTGTGFTGEQCEISPGECVRACVCVCV